MPESIRRSSRRDARTARRRQREKGSRGADRPRRSEAYAAVRADAARRCAVRCASRHTASCASLATVCVCVDCNGGRCTPPLGARYSARGASGHLRLHTIARRYLLRVRRAGHLCLGKHGSGRADAGNAAVCPRLRVGRIHTDEPLHYWRHCGTARAVALSAARKRRAGDDHTCATLALRRACCATGRVAHNRRGRAVRQAVNRQRAI